MNTYVTGGTIKKLREEKGLTQGQLANKIGVTDKAVSKWETGRGFPDGSLLKPLSEALGVSLTELVCGEIIRNNNKSANMLNIRIYVCPICSNVLFSFGEASTCCCGITLPPLEAEEIPQHELIVKNIEDEFFISIDHEMTKTHYISFIAYVTCNRVQLVKLYPEGDCSCYFRRSGKGVIYAYCNHHGLIKKRV